MGVWSLFIHGNHRSCGVFLSQLDGERSLCVNVRNQSLVTQLLHVGRAKSIQRRCQDAGFAGCKLIVALCIDRQRSQAVQLVDAVVVQMLLGFLDVALYAPHGFRIADVVGLDVGLYQQRVVQLQLGIETQGARRGIEQALLLVVMGRDTMRHKAPKIRNYHAVAL